MRNVETKIYWQNCNAHTNLSIASTPTAFIHSDKFPAFRNQQKTASRAPFHCFSVHGQSVRSKGGWRLYHSCSVPVSSEKF